MTKSPRKNVPDVGIELGAACMPSGHTFDRATAPGSYQHDLMIFDYNLKTFSDVQCVQICNIFTGHMQKCMIKYMKIYRVSIHVLGLKIPVFPLTRPTLFFCADSAIFIAFQKKKNKNKKRFSYLPTLKCFRKLDKNLKKCQNCKINAYIYVYMYC